MPKRKNMDDSIEYCKRFRDESFPVDNSRSDHEKHHLLDTNNQLAGFVRNSVDIMVYQRDEIERLNLVILEMRNSLVISESRGIRTSVNMDVM